MDLFDLMMFTSLIVGRERERVFGSRIGEMERDAERERDAEEPIIPNWLFAQPRPPIMQQEFRYVRPIFSSQPISVMDYSSLYPSSIPRAEIDTESIPEWLFAEEEIIPDWLFGQDRNMPRANNVRIHEIRPERDRFSDAMFFGRLFADIFLSSMEIKIRKKPVEFKEVKSKLIDKSKNIECPITYEPIKYGDAYATCSECKYNFGEEAILKHLNNCSDKICPMCRSNWVDYCKYVNKDEERERLLKNNISVEKISDFLKNEEKIFKTHIKGDLNKFIDGSAKLSKHNKKWFYGK